MGEAPLFLDLTLRQRGEKIENVGMLLLKVYPSAFSINGVLFVR